MNNPSKQSAFTLIELLVVIAIIGVLSTLAIVALGGARTKARDSKRVADMKQIATALELYFSDNGSYPTIITPGQAIISPDGLTTYMSNIPSNPTPRNDGNCANIDYSYSSNSANSSFSMSTCLGLSTSSINAGVIAVSSAGLFNCGQAITDVDGYSYTTVQIGSQCWMKENLKTKTKPNGVALTNLSNGSERDCISASGTRGTESDCSAGYTLYTWDGVMNGSTIAGSQGICSNGWHVPSDVEYNILDQYLTDAGQPCDAARTNTTNGCSTAGTKLSLSGASGYDAIIAGYRLPDGLSFGARTTHVLYWSSTQVSANAWHREISSAHFPGLVYRASYTKAAALSIRCLKD